MHRRHRVLFPLLGLLLLVLFGLGTYRAITPPTTGSTVEVRGVVTDVDNAELLRSGVGFLGHQDLAVVITEGKHKGQTITAGNSLIGSLETDEVYAPGDQATLALDIQDDHIRHAKMLNQYRQGWESVLFAIFVLLLLVYAGAVGFKAIFSFIASLLLIWKFLLPALLAGHDPLLVSSLTLVLLTLVIIFLVAGFSAKALAATLGTIGGLASALLLTIVFGQLMKISGLTAPFAATLVFSGHFGLDMQRIFYAAVLIGASGAAMDIAMDVAASMHEVKEAKPSISMRDLIRSGINVGRAVVGTMTTTLLLAYSGGYLTMLMLFVSKETSFLRILNFKMVAAEIFRTLIGSIGLVMVAPLTALIAAWLYTLPSIRRASKPATDLLAQPE
jgi:uncharacterized membrane protein